MLGKKLKELRKKKGLRQDELAAILGITRSQISSYEINRSKPSFSVLMKLSDFFSMPLDYFHEENKTAGEKLMQSLELSDDEFLKRVNLFYQGEKLSDEDIKNLLLYLRFLRNKNSK